MTKKFVALTMVLVLAAGVGVLAADDNLTGSWENTLTLDPSQTTNSISAFSSTLTAEYVSGGVTYSSISDFTDTGYTDQEFGVNTSIGLLTLDSTVDFDPSAPGLAYWLTSADLGLGGVNIDTLFLLQNAGSTKTPSFGAGMKLSLTGETPGGVSVTADNYFGMDENSDMASGYEIITAHGTTTDEYGPSSLQYVGSVLTLENMSLGCCDFTSETKFTEANGFEYTLFELTLTSNNLPISLAGDLKFTPQTKSIVLTPSITTDWACFSVYTDLTAVLGNNGTNDDSIESLDVLGFGIKDVELGDVTFSSFTALGSNTLYDLYLEDADVPYYTDTSSYDEVIRIQKLDEFTLDFTVDTYFDMSGSASLFDLALFEGSASYALSDQFTFGSGLVVLPTTGLDEISFSLDYSW